MNRPSEINEPNEPRSHGKPERIPNPPMSSNSMPYLGHGCLVLFAGVGIAILIALRLT
jgi:hypothetical protein